MCGRYNKRPEGSKLREGRAKLMEVRGLPAQRTGRGPVRNRLIPAGFSPAVAPSQKSVSRSKRPYYNPNDNRRRGRGIKKQLGGYGNDTAANWGKSPEKRAAAKAGRQATQAPDPYAHRLAALNTNPKLGREADRLRSKIKVSAQTLEVRRRLSEISDKAYFDNQRPSDWREILRAALKLAGEQ